MVPIMRLIFIQVVTPPADYLVRTFPYGVYRLIKEMYFNLFSQADQNKDLCKQYRLCKNRMANNVDSDEAARYESSIRFYTVCHSAF